MKQRRKRRLLLRHLITIGPLVLRLPIETMIRMRSSEPVIGYYVLIDKDGNQIPNS